LNMRKSFIILTLLIAINFANPASQSITLNTRHVIEYVLEDKQKNLTDSELLKNKVVMYLRLQILMLRVGVVNNSLGYNSS